MLAAIGNAIKARLEGLGTFKVVERGFSKRALQSPPSAVFYLYSDESVTDDPESARKLTYEIALLVSYLDPEKGQVAMDELIDAVRPAFTRWEPVEKGSEEASIPRIRWEGVEDSLLIYSARVTLDVYPLTIDT
jgi:hypothetical protein